MIHTEIPYKRYWVFGFSEYYPSGGMQDFVGSFDTVEEAREYVKDPKTYAELMGLTDRHYSQEYYDIVDSTTGESMGCE